MTSTSAAAAPVTIAPSSDGYVGAWLAAGPIGKSHKVDAASIKPEAGTSVAGARWRVVASAEDAIDLRRGLGTVRSSQALVGGTLVLKQAFDGWLLLGIDGVYQAWIDGKQVSERKQTALRGHAAAVAPLSLGPGEHTVVVRLSQTEKHLAFYARLLTRDTLSAPRSARLRLAGTDDGDTSRVYGQLFRSRLEAGLDDRGYHPRLTLDFPRGGPAESFPVSLDVRAGKATSASFDAGLMTPAALGWNHITINVPIPSNAAAVTVAGTVGALKFRHRAQLGSERAATLAKVTEAIATADGFARSTLLHAADRLSHATTRRSATNALKVAKQSLELATGKPQWKPGLNRFALQSPADGQPDPVLLHIPRGFDDKTPKPLVLLLHGLNGSPAGVMKAYLDQQSDAPRVGSFVVAPFAHGNAFYRGPGELAAMASVDFVKQQFSIDHRRISVTGVSMGGTGTAHLALRYADRFSAAAPLCGYHSFFVRRDTSGRRIRPWEADRMRHWSPASWAENGQQVPLYVAHGTKDFPLENSKVLIERYRKLNYRVTADWPDTGHAVWEKTYAGAQLDRWLSSKQQPADVRSFTIRTDMLRYGKQYWGEIKELEQPGKMSRLSVKLTTDALEVTTENLRAFKLNPPALPKTIKIDGQPQSAERASSTFRRTGTKWQPGAAIKTAQRKRRGSEGPIRDVLMTNVVFVYGTDDPSTARASHEVATGLAKTLPGPSSRVRYPVVADRDVEANVLKSSSLFLVGGARGNRVTRRFAPELPARIVADAVELGSERFAGDDVGALLVHPHPLHTERYIVVLIAVTPRGLYNALALPRLLPDFVVFNDAVAPASGQQVLGAANVLAAGFFDADWALPAAVADAPLPSRPEP